MSERRASLIVSVGGGKGGVGKSVVASNLSVAMAQAGRRVVLVDADLGAANQHTLLGIERPGPTLHALFTHAIASLEEARVPTGVEGLDLVAGSGAIAGAANLNHAQKEKLLRHIRALDADVVVVDVGAGVSFHVIDLFTVADVRLAVMNAQLTSIQNAYSLLKGAVVRELKQLAGDERQQALLAPSAAGETVRLPDRLRQVRAADPALGAAVDGLLSSFNLRLVGNQLADQNEQGTLFSVSRMVRDFLGVSAPVLGCVRASLRVHESVNRRRPLLLDYRHDEAAHAFRRMAGVLLAQPFARAAEAAPSSAAAPPEGQMPNLADFSRNHPRYDVSWPGRLSEPLGLGVRLLEVSLGGALIESPTGGIPAVGRRMFLMVRLAEGELTTLVEVRHARPDGTRAGVQFVGVDQVAPRLVHAAQHEPRPAAINP